MCTWQMHAHTREGREGEGGGKEGEKEGRGRGRRQGGDREGRGRGREGKRRESRLLLSGIHELLWVTHSPMAMRT